MWMPAAPYAPGAFVFGLSPAPRDLFTVPHRGEPLYNRQEFSSPDPAHARHEESTMKPFSNFAIGIAMLAAGFAPARSATLGGPLTLEDEGAFFVGGRTVTSNFPGASLVTGPSAPGRITVNQMYVHYRVPSGKHGAPVVMVHGSNHTGMTYETTPDGREGWATYFLRKGAPVYVVDHSGRGRSGFDPKPFNQARDQSGANPASLTTLLLATHERAWLNFRLGPSYPVPFPGLQFPVEAMEQYTMQLVPNAETSLAGIGANTVNALAVLLDRIGAAAVIVHSQSGVKLQSRKRHRVRRPEPEVEPSALVR